MCNFKFLWVKIKKLWSKHKFYSSTRYCSKYSIVDILYIFPCCARSWNFLQTHKNPHKYLLYSDARFVQAIILFDIGHRKIWRSFSSDIRKIVIRHSTTEKEIFEKTYFFIHYRLNILINRAEQSNIVNTYRKI